MSKLRSEREERLLQRIIETDGIKKIQEAITLVVGTTVDVSDRAARLLGQVYGVYNGQPKAIAVDSLGRLLVAEP